jgi:hypothetical protein
MPAAAVVQPSGPGTGDGTAVVDECGSSAVEVQLT